MNNETNHTSSKIEIVELAINSNDEITPKGVASILTATGMIKSDELNGFTIEYWANHIAFHLSTYDSCFLSHFHIQHLSNADTEKGSIFVEIV